MAILSNSDSHVIVWSEVDVVSTRLPYPWAEWATVPGAIA